MERTLLELLEAPCLTGSASWGQTEFCRRMTRLGGSTRVDSLFYHDEEEDKRMSCCYCVRNNNGYVMASDSRSTIIREKEIVRIDDNFVKMAYLPLAKVGVITAGGNTVDGRNIISVLNDLDDKAASLEDMRDKIVDRISSAERGPGFINVCVSASDSSSGPKGFALDFLPDKGININRTDILWFAGTYNPASTLYVDNDNLDVDIISMNLQTLKEFSVHLVETAISASRFHNRIPTYIGGPVQYIVVNRDGSLADSSL